MYNEVYAQAGIDIIATPMTAVPATPISASEPFTYFDGEFLRNRDLLRITSKIEPVVGAPGLSIPIGLSATGMPVGLQIQARPGVDA